MSEDQVLALAQAQADSLTQAVASVYPSIKFSYPVDNRGSVIRIGYVSGTGFTEPYRADQLIQDLYPLHDRSKFEVWCYATMEGDDARKPRVDAIRLCDKFFKVHTGDGLEAASMINSANIHLLADIHVYGLPTLFVRWVDFGWGHNGLVLGGAIMDWFWAGP